MSSSSEVRRRAVLVTGGSRGLGRGVAVELAAAGFSVAINYRSNGAAAGETADLCRRAAPVEPAAPSVPGGGEQEPDGLQRERLAPLQFVPIQGDISRADEREAVVDCAFSELGNLYGLVNNAGISPRERADIVDATEDSFTEVLGTNLTGPYFLTQLVVRRWLREPGAGAAEQPAAGGSPTASPRHHIVFISSISAATASTNRGEYCVSKAGLAMAAELWAVRLASEGINVYEVRPGIMETDMTAGVHEKYSRLIGEGLVPQRRWGTGGDIGRMVRALMSGDMPFSTGAVIYADGGFHISRL